MTESDPGAVFPTEGIRLEAVVDGRVAPSHLRRSERGLAELAAAARAQASTKELAGLADALIVFAAQQEDAADPGATWSRSRRSLGRMRSAGAVAAVVVVLGAGAAAAATTGELPSPLQHIAHSTLGAPESARHVQPHQSAQSHEAKHDSATSATSTHPSRTEAETSSKPAPSAKPSSSPGTSGVHGGPVPGASSAAHHHAAKPHPSAHPSSSGHAHAKAHHKHHKKHHPKGSGGSNKPNPKPSPSKSKSPRH